jgi:molybdenum cofactor cytidylyltransferase
MKVAGLILAAGHSSRLGTSKQLLRFDQQHNLLQHTEQLLYPLCDALWVVLGHQHEQMVTQLQHAIPIINENWQRGMGHSLKTGCQLVADSADAILIALCDQPLITQSHYQALISTARNNPACIISSHYQNRPGVPALFPAALLPAIMQIDDAQGARTVIEGHPQQHITLPCPQAVIDIDTPEDLQAWSRHRDNT